MFFQGAVVKWVEIDLAGWVAVSDGSADPAGGFFFSFGFEQFFAILEDLDVLSAVFLKRGDEVQRAVFVVGVVVGDEAMRPFLGFGE